MNCHPRIPYPPTHVVCDRGYSSHKFREYLWDRGVRPVILPRQNDPEVACPKWSYRHRHLVENLWAKRKHPGSAAIEAGEQPGFSAQGDTAQRAFGGVIRQADPSVIEEPGKSL